MGFYIGCDRVGEKMIPWRGGGRGDGDVVGRLEGGWTGVRGREVQVGYYGGKGKGRCERWIENGIDAYVCAFVGAQLEDVVWNKTVSVVSVKVRDVFSALSLPPYLVSL